MCGGTNFRNGLTARTHKEERGDVERQHAHQKGKKNDSTNSNDTGMNIEKPEYNSTISILSQAIYVSLIVDVVCATSTTNEDDYHFMHTHSFVCVCSVGS